MYTTEVLIIPWNNETEGRLPEGRELKLITFISREELIAMFLIAQQQTRAVHLRT